MLDSDLMILPKEEFYRLNDEERVRRITLWRINYSTATIIENMGFKTNQAFYAMLKRQGIPTAWNQHRDMLLKGELAINSESAKYLRRELDRFNGMALGKDSDNQNEEVIEMEEIKPQGMLVSIEIKGNTDISYMPKLFALAQEAGLEIKFQGSNADKKSNLN